MNKVQSKNINDLLKKVERIITNSKTDEKYIEPLKLWIEWYANNCNDIHLAEMSDFDKRFYRAFYEEPDVFGIQIWRHADNEINVWESNYYMSGSHTENTMDTTIVDK